MSTVQLTKRIEFSASHRYHNEAWDEARNREVFGPCNNPSGHGHNYLLEVTVQGRVGDESGMVVNLYDLKQVLKRVLEEFDHKHLNLDTAYFQKTIPTTENIAGVLWRVLSRRLEIGDLARIRLFEDDDLYADVTKSSGVEGGEIMQASLTRRYHFAAAHALADAGASDATQAGGSRYCHRSGLHGHNYVLSLTVGGEISLETGMVTDLATLDRLVHNRIIRRFDYRNLNDDPDLSTVGATGANVVRLVWRALAGSLTSGRLERVTLGETADMAYEYEGPGR